MANSSCFSCRLTRHTRTLTNRPGPTTQCWQATGAFQGRNEAAGSLCVAPNPEIARIGEIHLSPTRVSICRYMTFLDSLVPVGELALLAFAQFLLGGGRLGRIQAEHVDDHTADQREDLWLIIFPDHAGIIAEIDIEHPVKLVLHRPMPPNGRGHCLRRDLARGSVVALFKIAGLAAGLAQRCDQGDGFAIRPVPGVDRSKRRRRCPGQLGHDPAMRRIQMREAWQASTLVLAEGVTDLVQQAGLVALHHQRVITPLGDDLPGGQPMADADEKAFDVQGFEQFRNGGDLVALLIDPLLAEDNAQVGGKGTL